MPNRLLLAFLFLIFFSDVNAWYIAAPDTSDPGLFKTGAIPAKMLAARHEYIENNIRGALTIYREILDVDPENPQALYRTAECHYKLKRYRLAEEYLNKSLAIDENVFKQKDFFRGQIHHRLSELDKAIESFNAFLATGPAKNTIEAILCHEYLAQCEYAQAVMKNPAPVKIEHLGREINSRFDDYTPSVTADGKTLVFTSRRSGKLGGEIDEGGDYKFFEDIYHSKWLEEDGEWDTAEGIPGEVNTPTYDAVLSISPSGDKLYVYKNNAKSAGDIFVSGYDRHNESWRAPEKLSKPINTSYFEASVSITKDGNTMYFISERPGGMGQGDIWKSEKKSDGSWGKPSNLGDEINTELDEKFVFIHPNGKTLFFSSIGHQTIGSYDIFMSEYVNGLWSNPVNLGYPINTVNEESTFSLTEDNQTMYVAAEYDDTYGERDIYRIDVSDYDLLSSGYDRSSFGTVVVTVQDSQGKRLKNVILSISEADNTRVVKAEKTNKVGQARVNLQGNKKYLIKAEYKGDQQERLVTISLKDTGEALEKIEFTF